MQVTRATDYAVFGLIHLAENQSGGELTLLSDVAEKQNVPESFLAKIFQSLVKAGLATSHRGSRGGFRLARAPEKITVCDIVEAVEGPIALSRCLVHQDLCPRERFCPLERVWGRAQDQLVEVLKGTTLKDLVVDHVLLEKQRSNGDLARTVALETS